MMCLVPDHVVGLRRVRGHRSTGTVVPAVWLCLTSSIPSARQTRPSVFSPPLLYCHRTGARLEQDVQPPCNDTDVMIVKSNQSPVRTIF